MTDPQPSAVLTRPFYLLTAARLSATFGMYLNMLVVNIFILETTGSVSWVGALAAVRILSGMIFSPYAGSLADKADRKTLMIFSDFILALAIGGVIFVPSSFTPYYLLGAMFIIGVFSSLVDIALSAAVPAILHSKNTVKANAVLMGGRNTVIALAGISSVFIKEIFSGYSSVFIINALAYVISAVIILSINITTSEKQTAPPKPQKKGFFKNLKEEYKDVFALADFKVIAVMISVLTVDALASGSHNIGWPVFSKLLDPKNPFFIYGMIMAFWAFGNIIGVFWLAKSSLAKTLRAENLYLICTAIMSFGMIMTVQSALPAVIFCAACVAGFGDGAYQTFFNTYLQQAPDNVRGKLFGLGSTFMRTGFGASFIIMPFIFKVLPVSAVVFYAHLPVILMSGAFLIYLNRKNKIPSKA